MLLAQPLFGLGQHPLDHQFGDGGQCARGGLDRRDAQKHLHTRLKLPAMRPLPGQIKDILQVAGVAQPGLMLARQFCLVGQRVEKVRGEQRLEHVGRAGQQPDQLGGGADQIADQFQQFRVGVKQ